MEIDWITVSAQIVNFLILVWLLKRFLYRPVLHAMERREQRIADRLNDAQAREQAADEKVQQYQRKTEELSQQRETILSGASQDAEQQKKHMLDEARQGVEELRASWQRQVADEKQVFLDNLRLQTAEAVQAIARKALADLADAELEERVIRVFMARLKSLDRNTRESLLQDSEPMRISSAFELDSALRGRLTRAIHENLADDIEVDYRRDPALLCGLELASGAQRLSWNLANYTEELNSRIERAFAPVQSTNPEV